MLWLLISTPDDDELLPEALLLLLSVDALPELLFERDLSMERGQRLSEVFRDLERKNGEDADQ